MTAKQFYKEWLHNKGSSNHPDNIAIFIDDIMIDFAKFHVEKALEAVLKEGKIELSNGWVGKTETIKVNEESILNSYPPENIQ